MRTVLRLVSILLLVLVCLAAWVGIRGWLAKDHLQDSADLVQRLQTQVERGETVPAKATLTRLQNETNDAVHLTGDPVWRMSQHLPWVGDDLQAVHAVSVAGHTVSIESLPPLTAAAADVSELGNSGGGLSPKQLVAVARRLQAPLKTAQVGVEQAQQQIADVDTSGLFSPIRNGVDQFSSGLATLNTELKSLITVDTAAVKAGALLGA